jgi:hypothetical protein
MHGESPRAAALQRYIITLRGWVDLRPDHGGLSPAAVSPEFMLPSRGAIDHSVRPPRPRKARGLTWPLMQSTSR